jgi:hypothetical protein
MSDIKLYKIANNICNKNKKIDHSSIITSNKLKYSEEELELKYDKRSYITPIKNKLNKNVNTNNIENIKNKYTNNFKEILVE